MERVEERKELVGKGAEDQGIKRAVSIVLLASTSFENN